MTLIRRWQLALQKKIDAHLLTAVCRERVGLSRLLLMLGANPDVVGWREPGLVSALTAACVRQNIQLVKLLLAWGANPNGHPDETRSPMEEIELMDGSSV